jgi:hypothetical protein
MKSTLVALAMSIALASGCASHASVSASSSPRWDVDGDTGLGGTWSGALYETPSSYWYGHREFTVRIAPDGSWIVPGAAGGAAGTAAQDHRFVVVDGRLAGEGSPLHYTLKRYGPNQLFAVIETSFGGREATAILVLRRVATPGSGS